MKYSANSIDEAVRIIHPELDVVLKSGIHISRPELIKMVACRVFMWSEETMADLPSDHKLALAVLRQAQSDLSEFGQFMFARTEDVRPLSITAKLKPEDPQSPIHDPRFGQFAKY